MRPVLSPGDLEAFLPFPLEGGLVGGLPPHFWLEPPPFGRTRERRPASFARPAFSGRRTGGEIQRAALLLPA
jgi:hypothetical protein